MMLKWGCDLADQLFLPAWVEASPMGNHLYRRFGFRDVEVNEEGDVMQGSVMRREAKVEPLEGGKEEHAVFISFPFWQLCPQCE